MKYADQKREPQKDIAPQPVIPMPTHFNGRRIVSEARGTLYFVKGAPIEGIGFLGIE